MTSINNIIELIQQLPQEEQQKLKMMLSTPTLEEETSMEEL